MLQPNTPGKFSHPNLSSQNIVDLANLAAASYLDFYDNSVSGWASVTNDLVGTYGLNSQFVPTGTTTFRSLSPWFPDFATADAEATVFYNASIDALTVAFRGTEWEIGDSLDAEDWFEIDEHASLFDPLIDAVKLYADAFNIDDIWFTGHSLGGGVAELVLDANTNGNFSSISYNAVTFASPLAGHNDNDSRNLNIGHEGDGVYSISGIRGANSVSDFIVVMDDNADWLNNPFGSAISAFSEAFIKQHSRDLYTFTTELLLSSQFYEETDRNSKVVINYTEDLQALEEVLDELFFDSPALILGRDTERDNPFGGMLSVNDHLIGGGGDDYLEGFSGDDTLEGDRGDLLSGGNDTMAGGAGQDLFLGTPGDLDGDTIVDLEIGDRIGLSGETVTQEDVKLLANRILIDAKDGFFDFFGSEISINATRPTGASLKVLDEQLPGGGSIIEVVGQSRDIALLIDISGSMGDDIANVKSQATEIVNTIFERSPDSRVSIIAFNDLGDIRTILNFTDQETVEERKAAALAGIQNTNVSNGGTEPFYGAILSSLNGDAGAFRVEEGVTRQIIAFTDEPPGDPGLRQAAIDKAQDLLGSGPAPNAQFSPLLATVQPVELNAPQDMPRDATDSGDDPVNPMSLSVSPAAFSAEIAPSVLNLADANAIPTQIFTVFIGNNLGARAEYESLAAQTNGGVFTAANASDVADALLAILELPIYTIDADRLRVDEGNIGTQEIQFTISRDISGEASTVQLGTTGTTDLGDRSMVPTAVSFEPDELTKTVSITVFGDTQIEDDETISLSILNVDVPSTIAFPTATVTVTNDDENSPPSLIIDSRADTIRVQGEREGFVSSNRLLVADLIIQDDGNGTNNLSLLGPDADSFEIEDNMLYLSAGAIIDEDTKPVHQVIVAVDDPELGNLPEDYETYKIYTVEEIPDLEIFGTALPEKLSGDAGNDTIMGLAGNDIICGLGGNDSIDGGDGRDTSEYTGDSASYKIGLRSDFVTVMDRRADGDGTDRLKNVESLSFLDQSIDLDAISGATGINTEDLCQLVEYYIAFFNRAPDALGLYFWASAVVNGMGFDEVVNFFFDQEEVRELYGDISDIGAFVQTSYQNVLGRQVDDAGYNFWTELLELGKVQLSQFIMELLEGVKAAVPEGSSQEFADQKAADAEYLANKKDLGVYFAAIKGMNDTDNAKSVMAAFDGTDAGLLVAQGMVDQFYTEAMGASGELIIELVGVVDDPFVVV